MSTILHLFFFFLVSSQILPSMRIIIYTSFPRLVYILFIRSNKKSLNSSWWEAGEQKQTYSRPFLYVSQEGNPILPRNKFRNTNLRILPRISPNQTPPGKRRYCGEAVFGFVRRRGRAASFSGASLKCLTFPALPASFKQERNREKIVPVSTGTIY